MPKITAINTLKTKGFSEFDEILYENGIGPGLRKVFKLKAPKIKVLRDSVMKEVHNLVKIQNRVIDILNKVDPVDEILKDPNFKCLDLGKLLRYFKTVEHDPVYSIFETWNIKRKSSSEQRNNEVELSDDES